MEKNIRDAEKNDIIKNATVSQEALRAAAAIMGRMGGRAGRGDVKRRTPEQCRAAVAKRWDAYRKQKESLDKQANG